MQFRKSKNDVYFINREHILLFVKRPEDVLFQDYVIEILKIIRDTPGIKKTDVFKTLGTTSQKPRKIVEGLIETGIIEETQKVMHNVKELHLTERGHEYLKSIIILIGEEPETNYGTPDGIRNTVKE